MEDFPSLDDAVGAQEQMRIREEREQKVFAPGVDEEEAADCKCECCPPRSTQEQTDYCCRSLFSLPLLKKGQLLRDGLIGCMKEFEGHSCITKHPHFTEYILTESVSIIFINYVHSPYPRLYNP